MKGLVTIVFLAILTQGCATTYQSMGFSGGYLETQLDENVFKVEFSGNGYTGRGKVADFTLLRSAELALENGYRYFVIIGSNSYSKNSTYTTPTQSYMTGSAYGSGNYAYGSVATRTYGGQTYHISKPGSSNTIVCFKEKPAEGFSYNAEFIYKSMTRKYGIRRGRINERKAIN